METRFSAKTYDAIANICVFVAITAAFLFDRFSDLRWIFLGVGVVAGVVAAITYFSFHRSSKTGERAELEVALSEIERAVQKLKASHSLNTTSGTPSEESKQIVEVGKVANRNDVPTQNVVYTIYSTEGEIEASIANRVWSDFSQRANVPSRIWDYFLIGSFFKFKVGSGNLDIGIEPLVSRALDIEKKHEDKLWCEFVRFRREYAVAGKSLKGRRREISPRSPTESTPWGFRKETVH